jgi:WD40 repeat protein
MTGTKVCPPAAEADPAYHGTGASGLAVSPDGTRALVAFRHGSASLFDLQIGKELAEIDARYVASMSFLGGVQRAVTFGESISCWAVPVGKILWRVDLEHPLATNAALSPDGHHALVGTIDGRIELWTISKTNADLADFVDLARCGDRPTATAFAPDGGSFVVGTARGAILRFRLTEHR